MKKFMKAIAFVTVMCMALSTVAFADNRNSAVKSTTDDKTVIVTVTTAGANDQVALYIVEDKDGASTLDAPLFIDQKGMNEGSAVFTAKIAADVEAVKVFVGYAANTGSAIEVGTVALVQPITEITINKLSTDLRIQTVEGVQQVGAGVGIKLDVKAPKNVYATDMIWAIRYTDANGDPQVSYTDPMDVADYGIGTLLKGEIDLGLAFLNGFNRAGEEIASVEITDVDVIFLFTGGKEVLTNSEGDKGNKKNN